MDPSAYAEMDALEARHWWFRGRRHAVGPLVARMVARAGARPVAEVGCGTGGNLAHQAELGAAARLLGLDLDPSALGFARAKAGGADLAVADGARLPLADGSLGGVLALDVVEHLEDDAAALGELARVLAPGAELVLSVPAWPLLWSPHDDHLHHRRRYRPRELRERVRAAGLEVVEERGYNVLLLPPILCVRVAKRLLAGGRQGAGGTDFFELPGGLGRLVDRAIGGLLAVERGLLAVVPIRAGVTILLRARKPAAPGA